MKTAQILLLVLLSSIIGACQQNTQTTKDQLPMQTEMVYIPEGVVDPFSSGDTTTVTAFYMDKYLVTYAQYKQFIDAGGYNEKKYWAPDGWKFLKQHEYTLNSTYHEAYLSKEQLPITGISWYEAEAYARWRGARLPTAAEWTLACQGNTPKKFPWGDDFDYEAVNYKIRVAPYPVGSSKKNVSPFDIFDLVGNVWQWCSDEYNGKDFLRDLDPQGYNPGPQKYLRGGGWTSLRKHLESDYLYYDKPYQRLATYGFRCAKNVE